MADDKTYGLTRRKVLGSLGTIGAASAAAGAGTMAWFSDEESSTGNMMTAGELDLKIDVTRFTYNGPDGNVQVNPTNDGTGASFELIDVKPGDAGNVEMCVTVDSNPAWVHLGGNVTDYENGQTEPEAAVDSTDGDPGQGKGELSDLIRTRDWYTRVVDDQGNEVGTTKAYFQAGSLSEMFSDSRIGGGILLDGEPLDGTVKSGQKPFKAGYKYYLNFHWQWKDSYANSTDNSAQSDSVEFDLKFHAQQSRHNDNPSNPFA